MTLLVFTYLLSGCSPKDTQTMAQAAAVLDQGDYDTALALYDAAIEEGKQLQA